MACSDNGGFYGVDEKDAARTRLDVICDALNLPRDYFNITSQQSRRSETEIDPVRRALQDSRLMEHFAAISDTDARDRIVAFVAGVAAPEQE